MHIFIKTLTEKTITIDTYSNETIGDIKEKVHHKVGIPLAHQRMFFADKQLEDARTLSDYNITHDQTLYLVLRLRAGMCNEQAGRDDHKPIVEVEEVEEVEKVEEAEEAEEAEETEDVDVEDAEEADEEPKPSTPPPPKKIEPVCCCIC